MNIILPRRKPFIVLPCGIVAVSLLYQLLKGWDGAEFLLRVLGSTLVAFLIWRSGALLAQAYGGGGGGDGGGPGAVLRGLLWALLWASVAVLAVLHLAVRTPA